MANQNERVPKLIYLARRNPDLTREEFPDRWRQHSLMAGSFPSIRPGFKQVAQCLNTYDRTEVPRADLDYDGVNLLTMDSEKTARSTLMDDEAMAFLEADELKTFATYVRYFTFIATGEIVSQGPMKDYCLITFLKRERKVERAAFLEAITQAHQAMAGGQRRAVVNEVLDRMPGYNFDAITELWFASEEEAGEFIKTREYAETYLSARDTVSNEWKTLTMWTRINYARPPIE